MKFLPWLIILGILGGGGWYAWSTNQALTRGRAYDTRLAQLKRDFLTRSTGLSPLDADRYRTEVGTLLTSYFGELDKLAREFPELYDVERERKALAKPDAKKPAMNDQQKAQREERIAASLDLFNKMRGGQYRPLYTAADKTFRFDVYDMQPVSEGNEKSIRMSYVHWGAFGPLEYKQILGNIHTEQKKKLKEVSQIQADNMPPVLQVDAERWVQEFPPGMEIGYYDLPFFPHEAKSVDLSFDFGIRSVGGTEVQAHIVFPEMAIPDSWKLPEGQAWQAEERFASDEELRAAGAAAGKK